MNELVRINKTKTISTYDCFYLLENTNKESKKLLKHIIFCVNFILNKINSKENTSFRLSNEMYSTSQTKINSKENTSFRLSNEMYSTSQTKIILLNQTYINMYFKMYSKYENNEIIKAYNNYNFVSYKQNLIIKKKINDIFKKFNELNIDKKLLKGGSLNYNDNNYKTILDFFCNNVINYTKTSSTDDTLNKIIEEHNKLPDSYLKNELINLHHYINTNNIQQTYKITIYFNNFNYENYDNINNFLGLHTFNRECNYKLYNKEIVLSYEILQLMYNDNLQRYINLQIIYIQSLSTEEKNIIKDYTKIESFSFLNEYISNPTIGFIERYKSKMYFSSICEEFGNSFCDIICALYPQHNNINRIKYKEFNEDADEIYNSITEEQWHIILQTYLVELNRIILGAPATTEDFLCFRGSTSDYVISNTISQEETINIFLTNSRPSSISVNFESAHSFYNLGTDPVNKTMYRVLVTPGCKLLFATPLSAIKSEMEFIVPIYHIFASKDLFTRINSYNCFNNNDTICIDNTDKLYSKDIILLPV